MRMMAGTRKAASPTAITPAPPTKYQNRTPNISASGPAKRSDGGHIAVIMLDIRENPASTGHVPYAGHLLPGVKRFSPRLVSTQPGW